MWRATLLAVDFGRWPPSRPRGAEPRVVLSVTLPADTVHPRSGRRRKWSSTEAKGPWNMDKMATPRTRERRGHGEIEPKEGEVPREYSLVDLGYYKRGIPGHPSRPLRPFRPNGPGRPHRRLSSRGPWPSTGRPSPPVVAARAMRVQPPAAATSGRALSPDQLLEQRGLAPRTRWPLEP